MHSLNQQQLQQSLFKLNNENFSAFVKNKNSFKARTKTYENQII